MAHSTLPHDALTQHDRAIEGLRHFVVRDPRLHSPNGSTQAAPPTLGWRRLCLRPSLVWMRWRRTLRLALEVIAALGESFWWERNARQLGVDVPRGLEIRYHDLAKLASLCGIEIAELLRAAGPPTETPHSKN